MLSSHVSEKIWQQIKQQLNREAGKTVYNNWLESLKLVSFSDGKIEIGSHSDFHKNWIEPRYGNRIKSLWLASSDEINNVIFVVDKDMTSSSGSKKQSKKFNNLPISSPLDPRYKFEKFVVGPSNDFVAAAAQRVAETEDVAFNPLVIYGGVGLGKTHLMHSIAWRIREINPNRQVVYLSAEKFMYQFVKALRQQEAMLFKEQFRSADVLMVDDVQFIAGKDSTQEEFFHTFNALTERDSQIIISSDRSPSNLDGLQERIKSRLSGGLVIDIQPPDLNLRIKILKSKFEEIKKNFNENYNLNDEILNFLASEITSSIREMVGAFNRVLAFSKINTKSPSIYECRRILRDFISYENKSINIESIQNIVADHFDLNIQEMLSPRRSRSLARPRQIAMYLAKQYTTSSLPDIGRKFSNRDHTTVIHAVKKIEELIKNDNEINHSIAEIKKKLL